MFHRWLSATRSARRRRLTLQRKETELKAATIEVAWDKWRERYINEKLRPIASSIYTFSSAAIDARFTGV